MGDRQYRGSATSQTGAHYTQTPLVSGSKRSSKLRAKYLRISVLIYDNAIRVFKLKRMTEKRAK